VPFFKENKLLVGGWNEHGGFFHACAFKWHPNMVMSWQKQPIIYSTRSLAPLSREM
jgi:hypothetical protein